MGSTRYQIIAGTFRRCSRQYRGFNIHKPLIIKKTAQFTCDSSTHTNALLHILTAQIDVAISHPMFFTHVIVIELERWGFGTVENLQIEGQHLDFTRFHLRIDSTFRSVAYAPGNTQHKFIAHLLSHGENLGSIRVKHNLHQTLVVAQIDKYDAAVITTSMHPSTQIDLLIEVVSRDHATVVSSHIDFQ